MLNARSRDSRSQWPLPLGDSTRDRDLRGRSPGRHGHRGHYLRLRLGSVRGVGEGPCRINSKGAEGSGGIDVGRIGVRRAMGYNVLYVSQVLLLLSLLLLL